MRREVPVLLTILIGWVMVFEFFFPFLTPAASRMRDWTVILIAVAQIIGVANVARLNLQKISRRRPDWPYAVVLLGGLVAMMFFGLMPTGVVTGSIGGARLAGISDGTVFDHLYQNIYVPMSSTMFSLLAFFIASAAYRAFKIRTTEATLLAVTAVVVMLGMVPVGDLVWHGLPGFGNWIMNVPNLAAKRAIMIGAALGAIATGLKIILGLERNLVGE